ncbi:putative C6 transcription factor [Rhexocercosporidium sp. MPI-PUGE-AT-0058]|nr:putative C6 transcription factor [Rhexocercosporidium sp. MPI-PUGE-AT-0058]
MAEQPRPDADLKGHSCLTCRQRKVKCDRHSPCSNCVKARRQCSFIPPVRGRRRTKAPNEGLHAKLKRYEELLKSYGAKVELSEYYGDSDAETVSQPDVDMTEDADPRSNPGAGSFVLEEMKPRLMDKEGSSRYFESSLCSNLGGEFPYPEEDGIAGPTDESNIPESDLFVGSPEQDGLTPNTHSQIETLASLHPPYHVLLKLREIYVDRVDPLMKILHLPTFWSSLTNALQHPEDISKSLEALISAFYLATITSLEEDECRGLLGEEKSAIFARHERVARRALRTAGFLHTSSPVTLRAYVMFLMGVRSNHRSDTLFVLSGIAVRLARKMGLHRDGSYLGLSLFETEMRRRLWWHIVHVDFRISDLLGAKPSMDLFSGDAKMPLNVADEDLSPDMVDLPPESNGITSIVVSLIRCEFAGFLRKLSSPFPNDVRWETLTNPDITLAKKDSMINQLEDRLERKYLRFCDPSNTLHHLVSIMVRSAICKIKLFAHNPRRFANRGVRVPQSERDIIFTNATKLLEYVSLVRGNQSLDKYRWQIGASLLWNPLLYVLIEARHRKVGPEVDRLWQLIGVVLSKYPQMFEKTTGAVYAALGKWTLEAWDDYLAATKVEGLPEPLTPEYINAIRLCRTPSVESPSNQEDLTDFGPVTGKPANSYNTQARRHDRNPFSDHEPFASYDFSNLFSFEMDPDEWVQWENLVAGEGLAQNDIM